MVIYVLVQAIVQDGRTLLSTLLAIAATSHVQQSSRCVARSTRSRLRSLVSLRRWLAVAARHCARVGAVARALLLAAATNIDLLSSLVCVARLRLPSECSALDRRVSVRCATLRSE
jgi:hypothetical protein